MVEYKEVTVTEEDGLCCDMMTTKKHENIFVLLAHEGRYHPKRPSLLTVLDFLLMTESFSSGRFYSMVPSFFLRLAGDIRSDAFASNLVWPKIRKSKHYLL
jgi:hypothetical protein